jgi:hypothetical protein
MNTIHDLSKTPTGPVWVTQSKKARSLQGDIAFTIIGESDQYTSVIFPYTKSPVAVDLTSYAGKRAILASEGFKKALRLNLIELIDEEAAKKLNSTPAAQSALAQMNNVESSIIDTMVSNSAIEVKTKNTGEVSQTLQMLLLSMETQDENTLINTAVALNLLPNERLLLKEAALAKGFDRLADSI